RRHHRARAGAARVPSARRGRRHRSSTPARGGGGHGVVDRRGRDRARTHAHVHRAHALIPRRGSGRVAVFPMPAASMEKVVNLCTRRGFVCPGSEIYGGLGSSLDYGPLGVELKRNVKDAWWRAVVTGRDDVVGIDAALIMHPRVWEASGHVTG